jgi:hypothetical protein
VVVQALIQVLVSLGTSATLLLSILAQTLGLRVASIKETLIIMGPSDRAELDPFKFIGNGRRLRVCGLDVDGLPIGALLGKSVRKMRAGLRERSDANSSGAILRKSVGVEEDGGFTIKGILNVENGLILQAIVLVEKVSMKTGRQAT